MKQFFYKVTEKAGLSKTTPVTYIGNTFIQGFRSEDTTGERIKLLINQSLFQENISLKDYLLCEKEADCPVQTSFTSGATCSTEDDDCVNGQEDTEMIYKIPLLGTINLKNASLLTVSSVLGFIDGFNPCALWVLIMFLTFLIQTKDRKRMFFTAGTFIVAEAIMYYLILQVWMTTWNFIGLDGIVTKFVGLISLAGGIFFIYEYRTADGTCKVTSIESQKKTRIKIQDLISKPINIASFFGILALAFSVNIIEFACSLGIPQAFTKILDLNTSSFWLQQWYTAVYIFFYMIDDLIVFTVAIYSFGYLSSFHQYSKYANLFGGLLMLLIGGFMIFAPHLLIF